MLTIVMSGGPENAPVVLSDSGKSPSWSGKSIYDLSRQELESIALFTMDEAYELGKEDFIQDRPMTDNPFHPRFMQGVPHDTFHTFYQRGHLLAAGSWSASMDFRLFGEKANGRLHAAVPV